MSDAIRFLHALAQTLSASTLYAPGHPATRRSLEHLWRAATALLAADPHPVFLFLGTAPVYAGRALHELREWHHSARLAAIGVQRLEFDSALTLDSLVQLVERLTTRLNTGQPSRDEVTPIPGVVFGVVAVQGQGDLSAAEPAEPLGDSEARLRLDLTDELAAMQFILAEAARGVVARAEAEAVVRILVALVDPHQLPQAAHLDYADRYHLVHPVNTALLAMTAAGAVGVDGVGRHQIGVVALLHDIGMVRLPPELATKESLTDAERTAVEAHTVSGAELLLRHGGVGSELAAVVAFEHHLRPDGNGYPTRRFSPTPHWASRLVACCAAFAALRAPRPLRAGWPTDRVVLYVEECAGTVFDAEIATLVASVVRSS